MKILKITKTPRINYRKIKHILLILTFLALNSFILLYIAGIVEIPFFVKQGNSDGELNTDTDVTEEQAAAETIEPTTAPANLNHVVNTDLLTGDNGEPVQNESWAYRNWNETAADEGYKITDERYDKDRMELFYVTLPPDDKLLTSKLSVPDSFDIKMGYIYIYDGNSVALYDKTFKMLSGDLNSRGLEMIYQRDKNNLPVFQTQEGYICFDEETGSYNTSDYNAALNRRGASFSYPSRYGYPVNTNLVRFYGNNNKWGYKNTSTDEIIIPAIYDEAYNFNNGYAVAIIKEYPQKRKLCFLDESGNILNPSYSSFEGYYVYETAELESGADDIGFYYFEDGLTRALYRQYHWRGYVIDERTMLCYPDGSMFEIPADYNAAAFREGIIVLEKNGKYGYMDSHGNWIINPILSYAGSFSEGIAVIGLENNKKALIDSKGNLLTAASYDYITECSGGVIGLYEARNGWTFIYKTQK